MSIRNECFGVVRYGQDVRGGADGVGAGNERHDVQTAARRVAQPVENFGHRLDRAQPPRVLVDAQPPARSLLVIRRGTVPEYFRHHAAFHQPVQGPSLRSPSLARLHLSFWRLKKK